jgi:6-phosphogluconolactonase
MTRLETVMSSLLRRGAFALPLLFLNFMSTTSNATAADKGSHDYLVYIGTYGTGVHAFKYAGGKLTSIGEVGEVKNPSWLSADPHWKHLYAVSELDGKEDGAVASFSMDRKTGKLTPINHVGSAGQAPCYLSIDSSGRMVIVANYVTGGVSSYPIHKDGSIGEIASLMKAEGSGPNKSRQEGPHAHEAVITPDNKRVYVPDLGLDRIRIYQIDPATAKLTPNDPPYAQAGAGHGPRHLVFDKAAKYAYLVNEIKPFVSVFERDASNGALKHIQDVPTIPEDFKEDNTGAEIRMHPSGKFVYASNRGHDSIQVFAVDSSTGKLSQVQVVPTGGKEPRGFALDPTGQFLIAGNQKSNSISVFKVDAGSGHLTATGEKFDVPTPVDVLFVPVH